MRKLTATSTSAGTGILADRGAHDYIAERHRAILSSYIGAMAVFLRTRIFGEEKL